MLLLHSGDSPMLTLCRREALMGCNLCHVDLHEQNPAECSGCLAEEVQLLCKTRMHGMHI